MKCQSIGYLAPILALLLLGACATEKQDQVIYKLDRVGLRLEELEDTYEESYADQNEKLDEMARRLATESEETDLQHQEKKQSLSELQADLEWLESLFTEEDTPSNATVTITPLPTPEPEPADIEGLPELRTVPTRLPVRAKIRTATEAETIEVSGGLNERDVWMAAERLHATSGCTESKAAYARFIIDFPTTAHTALARLRLAECYLAEKQYEPALEQLDEAAQGRLDRVSGPPILQKRAACYEALKQPSEAEESYWELVERFPESAEAGAAKTWLENYGTKAE